MNNVSFIDQQPEKIPLPEEASLATPPLTAAERVLVRDGWNKFLVHQDMLIELFVARLLHEEPDLIQHLSNALNDLPLNLLQLLQQAVDQLAPPAPVCPYGYRQASSPPAAETNLQFDAIRLQPQHWLTARRVWLWTMRQVPQLEPYDQENLAKEHDSALYRFFSLYVLLPALDAYQQRTDEFLSTQQTILASRQRLLNSAWTFIHQIAEELNWPEAECNQRWREIKNEIDQTGTYTHTTDELTYGAMLSWRNASKCIGRISWRTMKVRDRRHVTDPGRYVSGMCRAFTDSN